MNIHQSEVLSSPTNNELTTLLGNLPAVLQWNTKYQISKDKLSDVFTELPPELKSKILSYKPRVNIAQSELTITNTELFTEYCINQPITKKDFTAYLLTNVDKQIFKIFRIFYLKGHYLLTVNKYEVIREDDIFVIYKLGDYNRKEEIGTCETVEEILAYVGLSQNNYTVMFDPTTTKNIVKMRLSCMKNNYIDLYLNNVIKIFVNYFIEFPIVIYKYDQLFETKKDQKYILYIKLFENKANKIFGKYNIFYKTDNESQNILKEYYTLMFKTQFLK